MGRTALQLVLVLLVLTACSQSSTEEPSDAMFDVAQTPGFSANVERISADKARNPNLAYEHNYTIDLDEDRLKERYEATLDQCGELTAFQCIVIDSSFNSRTSYSRAQIRVRIKTEGVVPLLETASQGGEVVYQAISAEDLTEAVVDIEKRIAMLRSYQDKLMALESRADQDVESLIKVAEELSKVQADIESAMGRQLNLQRRILLDLVTINFESNAEDSFWGIVFEAIKDFGYNLADGISTAITGVAYILPWIIALLFLFFVFKGLWKLARKRF